MRHRSVSTTTFQVLVTIISLLSLLAVPAVGVSGVAVDPALLEQVVETPDNEFFCLEDCSAPERSFPSPVEDTKAEGKLAMEEPPVDPDNSLPHSLLATSAKWNSAHDGAPQWRPDEVHRPPIA